LPVTTTLPFYLRLDPNEKCDRGIATSWRTGKLSVARTWSLIVGLFAVLLAPTPLRAQGVGNVLLESNEQLFCVLAALNAAGYDAGMNGSAINDTRRKVREYLEAQNAPILPEMKKFYTDHQVKGDPSRDLAQYISLALLVGSPPDFKLTVPAEEVPPDARDVQGFLPLLRTFYSQTNMLFIWAQVHKQYDDAVARYTEAVRQSFVLTEAYLRFPAGGYLGRTYAIYIDLMGTPEQVHARIYGLNYFLVITPSEEPKLEEIRFQYLHFLLDPLAAKYGGEIAQKAMLAATARQAPMLALDFKEDFGLLITECLIRALELRMDKRPAPDAQKSLDEMTSQGLILVHYFYESLLAFEHQEASMTVYYKSMILAIDPHAEDRRLFVVHFATRPPAPVTKVAPAQSEEDQLLDKGDNEFFEGKYLDAKASYEAVLEKDDPKSERAIYGMAVVYANTRKPDLAEEYFQKALATAHDLRIVTWSHIYLGRLDDLNGKRDTALVQYHAALLTAAAFPMALRAAQSGMESPFGSPPGQKQEKQ
jgi:tetratricopeptide (TPR) repeat protein